MVLIAHELWTFEGMEEGENVMNDCFHTTEDNLPARALYSSAGYEVTEIGACTEDEEQIWNKKTKRNTDHIGSVFLG